MHHGSSNCAVAWTSNYSVLQFIQRFKHTSPENDLVPKACSQWLEMQIFFKPYNPGPLKGPVPASLQHGASPELVLELNEETG